MNPTLPLDDGFEPRHATSATDRQHLFESQVGSAWRPRAGSKVSHANMTAAMIDSRDFLSVRRRAETDVLIPAGTKIALGGGMDYNDHELIWARLDQAYAKHPDMVLLHGGSRRVLSASPPAGPRLAR